MRAFEADVYAGAKGDAREQFITTMRSISKEWFKDPWLTVLPYGGNPPPITIMIENQGEWEKIKFGWADAIRTWDVSFLRDNPLSQLYLTVESAASTGVETAAGVPEARRHLAVGARAILPVPRHPPERGEDPADAQAVLERDRHPVKRTCRLPFAAGPIGRLRLPARAAAGHEAWPGGGRGGLRGPDARGRDLSVVSKIRSEFVANLALFETSHRKRARRGV